MCCELYIPLGFGFTMETVVQPPWWPCNWYITNWTLSLIQLIYINNTVLNAVYIISSAYHMETVGQPVMPIG